MIYIKNNADTQTIQVPRNALNIEAFDKFYTKEETDIKIAETKNETISTINEETDMKIAETKNETISEINDVLVEYATKNELEVTVGDINRVLEGI